jgi:predicted DNA-binding transcriptional regulator YafY
MKALAIKYTDKQGRQTSRSIIPIAIYDRRGSGFVQVFAYCTTKSDCRTFHAARMKSLGAVSADVDYQAVAHAVKRDMPNLSRGRYHAVKRAIERDGIDRSVVPRDRPDLEELDAIDLLDWLCRNWAALERERQSHYL